MRTMNTEKLIKTLPVIQNQLDALLDFQVPVHNLVCLKLCGKILYCDVLIQSLVPAAELQRADQRGDQHGFYAAV